MSGKGRIIRERYEATCKGYDELYRAEQYAKYAVALKKVPPRGKVLDAGCGTALLAEYMKVAGLLDSVEVYVCLDYSPCMLNIALWRLSTLCSPGKCVGVLGNVEKLPLPSKHFDVVYSFTVLDLVDDLHSSVSELLRVSRGPVIASLLKRLSYKDSLLELGAEVVGITDKDVILLLNTINLHRVH
ncbi:MAG: methyltransferase domain-containing protein [Desulfurococcales archaeon]|nr:methyltransferase domain-containing protein [Desulfurococcales archaeon]